MSSKDLSTASTRVGISKSGWLASEIPKILALKAIGLPRLLERFAAGETIAATDPAVLALHAAATANGGQLAAAAGVSPGKLPTGTLRALLKAIGWKLKQSGRIKARGADRDEYVYTAQREALPDGVTYKALNRKFMEELKMELNRPHA
jgi:hypothetical protein